MGKVTTTVNVDEDLKKLSDNYNNLLRSQYNIYSKESLYDALKELGFEEI